MVANASSLLLSGVIGFVASVIALKKCNVIGNVQVTIKQHNPIQYTTILNRNFNKQ